MAKQHNIPRLRGMPPIPPSHSIDLHGYRKSEGIKALTSFLDHVDTRGRRRNKHCDIWVLVITGSGAHSPEGPVLRETVKNLLDKRQMEYFLNRGKGSFTVNASSGIAFYEPPDPVDSKIILKVRPETIPALPKGPTVASQTIHVYGDDAPTLQEVAALDKAIKESRIEQQKVLQETKREEKLLKRAASLSLLDVKEDYEEQEMMDRAVSMSLLECNVRDAEGSDHDLQRALELSQTDFEQHSYDVDEEIRKALVLSQNFTSTEDEQLQQILELSMKEYSYDPGEKS
jgi:Smr domain